MPPEAAQPRVAEEEVKHVEEEELELQAKFWGKTRALEQSNSVFNENVNLQDLENALKKQVKDIQKSTFDVDRARLQK